MSEKQRNDWLEVRSRLHEQARAVAAKEQAHKRGEPVDLLELSIQRSEVRALHALSRALLRKTMRPGD
jgi:hypothetical protein